MEQQYSLQLERGGQGRITQKNELVNGWSVRWEYRYDGAGRLAGVNRDGTGVELYLYDAQGRRAEDYVPLRGQGDRTFRYGPDNRLLQAGDARYEHDNRGFRSRKVTPQGETRYHYAPDYRLLAVELPDGKVVEYAHDEHGLRGAKYVNGRLTERFRWHDRAHLAAWSHADMAGGQWWEVAYGQDGRPIALVAQNQKQTGQILLHTDQIGSARMIEFPTEGMVKEVLYDAFGNVVKDGNPYLRSPLGFAGGLHDWDTGLVRFGWRDYDPDTGRFTAKDPIGAAGGDSDWYGYCLDDPVNGRDPVGLFRFGKRPLNHLPWLGPLSDNPLDDMLNTEISHENGFYEDGSGRNIGFFKEGPRADNVGMDKYRMESEHYDDKRMKRAEDSISPGKYHMLTNNCQDYADKLRARYRQLERGDKQR